MKPILQIKTEGKQENDEPEPESETEPVSPTGQYLSSKTLNTCILAILESEVPIDESCLVPQLRDVFLPINPRFSSIMITDKKGVRLWKKVKVNLHDHVNIPRFPEGLSTESYDNFFDEYLTKISSEPLPEERPLWELHIINCPTSKAAGHMIFKLHHALGDGYSLMGALLSCVKRADDPSLPLTFPSTRGKLSEVKMKNTKSCLSLMPIRTLSAIYKGASDLGWSFMKTTCISDDQTPIRSGNKNPVFNPINVSTLAFSLDQIKFIKTKLGATVNDTISGIIFLGTRLYMQETQTKFCNSRSTAMMILNTRIKRDYMSVDDMINADTKIWGNKFSFLHIALPKLINDKCSNPLDFVYKTGKQIKRYRSSPVVYLTSHCLRIMREYKGCEVVAKRIHSTLSRSSMTMSNMIGPVEQVTLAGHPIKGMYFMITGNPQSLVISVMSYSQTLRIGVGAEKGFIDSKKLNSCIENAFELIFEAATKSK
ncbi:wax ester synthase/diacylglycerol acyltransferase 4 isoform X2 [Spinacia oleracea]|uniref:Wax ester synthase/diacylglycerol acyltransferase 4 isoform X2 n=1 Tax=Spinacia oleracea TaxID=3562 RepID=A0ABM3RDV4_SPIOL|nr:wax ester synthase/diacylglycerol acyltransferase 4-like isoform X2 [Spinacia oleracea]